MQNNIHITMCGLMPWNHIKLLIYTITVLKFANLNAKNKYFIMRLILLRYRLKYLSILNLRLDHLIFCINMICSL